VQWIEEHAMAFGTRTTLLTMAVVVARYAMSPASDAPRTPDEAAETGRAREFLKRATQDAAEYTIQLEDNGRALERLPDPVLQWSNPVVGELYGGVFLWTRDGRPEVAAAIFKWYSPHTHRTHEFQSLSSSGVVGSRDEQQVWTASQPGVDFRPVSDAPSPVETSAGRLLQMRRLARGFHATIDHRTEGTHDLRLLSQPLYRYTPDGDAERDGALFAFVLGTDPEALLLLELQRTAEGRDAWHFAPARMNFQPLRMTYDDVEVWNVPMLESKEIYRGEGTYVKFQFDDPQVVP
jgi:hypothetical protein